MCVLYKWDLRQNNILVIMVSTFRYNIIGGARGSYCTWIPHMIPQIRHNLFLENKLG